MKVHRGFSGKLDKYIDINRPLVIAVSVDGQADYDFLCLGINNCGSLTNKNYIIFANQARSPQSEIVCASQVNQAVFTVNLTMLPRNITRLALITLVKRAGLGSSTLGGISLHNATISQNGQSIFEVDFNNRDFSDERAIVTLELYEDEGWNVSIVGNGSASGLRELLEVYNGKDFYYSFLAPYYPETAPDRRIIHESAGAVETADVSQSMKNSVPTAFEAVSNPPQSANSISTPLHSSTHAQPGSFEQINSSIGSSSSSSPGAWPDNHHTVQSPFMPYQENSDVVTSIDNAGSSFTVGATPAPANILHNTLEERPLFSSRISNRNGPINLKKGECVDLASVDPLGLGEVWVNLRWQAKVKPNMSLEQMLDKASSPDFSLQLDLGDIDLDLGCLYELKSGRRGLIQALGKHFGALDKSPYILLDGDDRTGNSTDGENLRIDGNRVTDFRRILIYAFIYNGVANWREAQGVVTIRNSGASPITINLDEYDSSKKVCALALLENVCDQTFSVQRLVKFYNDHREMDQAFNWGMSWIRAKK